MKVGMSVILRHNAYWVTSNLKMIFGPNREMRAVLNWASMCEDTVYKFTYTKASDYAFWNNHLSGKSDPVKFHQLLRKTTQGARDAPFISNTVNILQIVEEAVHSKWHASNVNSLKWKKAATNQWNKILIWIKMDLKWKRNIGYGQNTTQWACNVKRKSFWHYGDVTLPWPISMPPGDTESLIFTVKPITRSYNPYK